MNTITGAAAAVVAGGLAVSAGAQPIETSIRIAVDGDSEIVVLPGATFRVEALITYPYATSTAIGIQFSAVSGSIVVQGHEGVPSAYSSFYPNGGLVQNGAFHGGSRMGINIWVSPAFFMGGLIVPQIPHDDGLVGGYDLLIDRPGTYWINWRPTAAMPNILVYPSVASPAWSSSNSSYFGATVRVVECRAELTTGSIPGQAGYGEPNGVLNNDDFFYYLTQFAAGNLAVADMTTTALAGTTGYGVPDGVLNNDDFFFYLGVFAGGCGV